MKKEIRVWDPLVRVFHWALVLSFAIAWISADEFDTLHFWAGYTIAALVAFRIVWGFIGTRHARFSDFVYRINTIKSYLIDLAALRPKHYVGHNPAGGLMVIVLLLSLGLLTFTGMASVAPDGIGPLAGTWVESISGYWMEDVHEAVANLVLAFVLFHISGVLISSLVHGENLVRAMINGKKEIEEKGDEN
ncbi:MULTISPECIES: cytochrome b/b6 domain-containing protein [unclassified Marinobacterium]|jgi:cytochrome b|uniref:cytochrome b/b6 domain-containing protein n=1 Tax=unclassified Marinobacterium TaxID=2644139 RepID=UPI00156A44D3|nr:MULTISPECIES: cytochrome b/b6 domain-containing protein [unclassified Marinobacterium]NRP10871.1 putative Ni/Fe-hydrogenase B-type cytochrome subunit [Marinobacterium sp. xm-g-48]NRP14848.1 putative Ni/Fe-hydrogenase B-type cytochrome subunit [Marinobacterium sp. xm-a-152]NRP36793.1 putative Ni/Fe-hydrogenase B-type cytochrome subunit [Marinobacterium sp. xm-d-579]NRP46692.1 putative Ni/Fe-hydrogenase B-type cytochrome subunit [Marinobacterium sp. xm-d-543]NRP58101.1 putative Ni/Fe-hydrogen